MQKTLTDEQMVGLMVRHGGRLRAFVSTLLPLSHDIDEVLQNTCLVAWRKLGSFQYEADDPTEEFLRWQRSPNQGYTSRLGFISCPLDVFTITRGGAGTSIPIW